MNYAQICAKGAFVAQQRHNVNKGWQTVDQAVACVRAAASVRARMGRSLASAYVRCMNMPEVVARLRGDGFYVTTREREQGSITRVAVEWFGL